MNKWEGTGIGRPYSIAVMHLVTEYELLLVTHDSVLGKDKYKCVLVCKGDPLQHTIHFLATNTCGEEQLNPELN